MPYELWLTKKPEQRHTKPEAKPILKFPIEFKRITRTSWLLEHDIDVENSAIAKKLNLYQNYCVVDTDIDIVVISNQIDRYNIIPGDIHTIKWHMDFPLVEEKLLRDVCKLKLVDVD